MGITNVFVLLSVDSKLKSISLKKKEYDCKIYELFLAEVQEGVCC